MFTRLFAETKLFKFFICPPLVLTARLGDVLPKVDIGTISTSTSRSGRFNTVHSSHSSVIFEPRASSIQDFPGGPSFLTIEMFLTQYS